MILIAYLKTVSPDNRNAEMHDVIPIVGIPACGMYHKITVFDLVIPRLLAGERIGRDDLAALGHGDSVSIALSAGIRSARSGKIEHGGIQ